MALWMAPEQLVGREVRVLWPLEEAWFCGRVMGYDPARWDRGPEARLCFAGEVAGRQQEVLGGAMALC